MLSKPTERSSEGPKGQSDKPDRVADCPSESMARFREGLAVVLTSTKQAPRATNKLGKHKA